MHAYIYGPRVMLFDPPASCSRDSTPAATRRRSKSNANMPPSGLLQTHTCIQESHPQKEELAHPLVSMGAQFGMPECGYVGDLTIWCSICVPRCVSSFLTVLLGFCLTWVDHNHVYFSFLYSLSTFPGYHTINTFCPDFCVSSANLLLIQ